VPIPCSLSVRSPREELHGQPLEYVTQDVPRRESTGCKHPRSDPLIPSVAQITTPLNVLFLTRQNMTAATPERKTGPYGAGSSREQNLS